LVLLLVFTVAVLSRRTVPHEVRFQAWMEKYNRVYATQDEYQTRLANFVNSTKIVNNLNAESKALGSDAEFELNKFADMSADERRALRMPKGYKVKHHPQAEIATIDTGVTAPTAFDWRTSNKVTPVKDQAQCGSCWAFSCTESIESVYIIKNNLNGGFTPLAPQQIVDCDKTDLGCNGGDLPTCYQYVIKAGGLEKSSDYPYTAKDGACKAVRAKEIVGIKGFKYAIPQGSRDENSMASFLAANSPVSIIVGADKWDFYKSGIFTAAQCDDDLDHAVQAVGYDTGAGFWSVRNSWGADWGEQGYIRLQFGKNTCGMTSECTVPTM